MKTAKTIILWAISVLLSATVMAGSSGRKVIDPDSNPYAKLVGELTQIKDVKGAGNAFIVGAEGCYVITNYHVAFGKSKNSKTGEVEIVDDADTGHVVNFAFDLDGKTGKFKRQMKAKVIDFGNYEPDTTQGLVGDLAILKLDSCLGKEFAGPELDRPERGKFVPRGDLLTLSTSRTEKGLREILVEDGCYAESITPIAGAFLSNCYIESGMSGSMILEKGVDGKNRLVGVTTSEFVMFDGSRKTVAIYSNALAKLIDSAIGGR